MKTPHVSVLSSEVLEYFTPVHLRYFVDGTLGAGGHSELILNAHPEIEKLIGIDQDSNALKIAQDRLASWEKKVAFCSGNFKDFDLHLHHYGIEKMDGMLCDLGVSSMQLDMPERGFSFSKEGPLDMRMDIEGELTAADIVNTWSEKELGKIFREYGEEKKWRVAAKLIVSARAKNPILTTQELVKVLEPLFSWKKKGINPMTLIFQALRIAVNKELEVLEDFLKKAIEALRSGGRLAVISFHSLEDRLVKNAFRFAASDKYDTAGLEGVFLDKKPEVKILTGKPIIASEAEISANPRSRSAKLRVIEKL